jgi:ankyrin repeat protein
LEIVKILVESGADKEAKDNTDWTPLQWAQKRRHISIVDYLKSDMASKKTSIF